MGSTTFKAMHVMIIHQTYIGRDRDLECRTLEGACMRVHDMQGAVAFT